MLVFWSIRNAEVRYYANKGKDDGADEEEPSPCGELCGYTSKEDTSKEANGGKGSVKTED